MGAWTTPAIDKDRFGAGDLLTETICPVLSNGHDHDNDQPVWIQIDAQVSRLSAWAASV
jgi:hypothetical protein